MISSRQQLEVRVRRPTYQHLSASISLPGVSMHFRISDVCCRTASRASSSRRPWSSEPVGVAMMVQLDQVWAAGQLGVVGGDEAVPGRAFDEAAGNSLRPFWII